MNMEITENHKNRKTTLFHLESILRLTSFYGLFPFRRHYDSFRIDRCLAAYSVCFSFVFLISGLLIISSCLLESTSITKLPMELEALEIILQATLLICNLSFMLYNLKKMNSALKLIRKVNNFYNHFNIPRDEGSLSFGEVLEITLPYILFVTNTSGTMQGVLPFFVQVYRLMANLAVLSVTAQFTRFLGSLQGQFSTLLQALTTFRLNWSEYSRVGAVNHLVVAHSHLCRASYELGEAYSPQVLVALLYSFSGIILQSYFVVEEMREQHLSLQNLIPRLNLVILSSFVTWRIASSAVKLREKAKEFNSILYQIMIGDKTKEILNNKKLKLHISMKQEVVLTACGLFNLDYTLLRSMIASATTYLVILIQFQQPSKNFKL